MPLDVVELIMEQLAAAGFIIALRQCSLACKVFAEICQRHIFTDIVLSNTPTYRRRNLTVSGLTSFTSALDNKPYLEGYVHVLYYSHGLRDWLSDFPLVFRRLRHVHSLRLRVLPDCISLPSYPSFKKSLLRFIRSNQITHLDLYFVRDLPTSVFAHIPRLEILKITDVTLHHDPSFIQAEPPKLRDFYCESSKENSLDGLIDGRNGIVDFRALKHLQIDMGDPVATMRVIEHFIRQSEALESLTFDGGCHYTQTSHRNST